jgi:phosphate transport system substrate-binding protein
LNKPISILLIALMAGAVGSNLALAIEAVPVSGSTTVLPLAEGGGEGFNAEQSEYRVTVTGGGTGVGMKNIAQGTSDISMASREVTADEISQFGDQFQERLIAYDGIVIAVSKEIYEAGVTALTKDQVKRIYAGETRNWKEVGGPDEEILVAAREMGSGTRDTFNEEIMDDKKAETPGVSTVAGSNAEIRTTLTGSDKAIGYLGFSYAEDGSVGMITLDGVTPTAESIKDGSYELARRLYFYTFGDASPGAQAFINFMTGPKGQQVAEEYGFVPLESSVQKAEGAAKDAERTEEEAESAEPAPGFNAAFAAAGLLAVALVFFKRRS